MDEKIVLFVDDEEENRNLFFRTYQRRFTVLLAPSGQEALAICAERKVDLVVSDQRMPGMLGVDLLATLAAERPEIIRVLVTGFNDLATAVDAINRGKVHSYVAKPWNPVELENIIKRELEVVELKRKNLDLKQELEEEKEENVVLRERIEHAGLTRQLIGNSKAMTEVLRTIHDVADSDTSVLILGETGTGKELVARAIHELSSRSGPFLAINCPALSKELLDSELFGHEKGAFTGAIRRKQGRFELAAGGTLFLDEIGDLAPPTQARLLRVLQERTFERVGGETTLRADVRVVSATNRDLNQAIREGKFRQDLFYRLNVVCIVTPPLRDRMDDVPLLCESFLARQAAATKKSIRGFTEEAMQYLLNYRWPGNVRELENIVERAVTLAKEEIIGSKYLPDEIRSGSTPVSEGSLRDHEAHHIRETLVTARWNKHEAARRLGITRSTLYSKMKRYHIEPPPSSETPDGVGF